MPPLGMYDMLDIHPYVIEFAVEKKLSLDVAGMDEWSFPHEYLAWIIRWDSPQGLNYLMKIKQNLKTRRKDYPTHWDIFLGVWKDKEDGRHSKSIMLKENAKQEEIIKNISQLLSEGYSTLMAVTEDQLDYTPELSKDNQEGPDDGWGVWARTR